jgi:hypothetical protein
VSTLKVDTYLTRGGASEIAIDKLKGVTAAGSMLVVGEGGTVTTNVQQGLCKQWVESNGSTAIQDSFNTTSLTDNGTGDTTTTIANNMGNATFCVNATTGNTTANPSNYTASASPVDVTSHRSKTFDSSNGSLTDTGFQSRSVHGDLA